MDTEWYGHLSGYNYACLYDFASRYYPMSRPHQFADRHRAGEPRCSHSKVPTEKYQAEEIGAIARFVERGGGVLLIGEHTDVFAPAIT